MISQLEFNRPRIMKTLLGATLIVAFFCLSAYGELKELPPMEDVSSLTIEELLNKAAKYPGLEYLKDNSTLSTFGITPTNIHPDIIHDAFLLTVSILV